jgi:hypothetical protein
MATMEGEHPCQLQADAVDASLATLAGLDDQIQALMNTREQEELLLIERVEALAECLEG